MSVSVWKKGNHLVVDFYYDVALVDRMRNVPGARWNKTDRHWTVPKQCLPFVMVQFPEAKFTGPVATAVKAHAAFLRASQSELELNGDYDPEARALYQFQRKGVYAMDNLERGLIADQMGLGKTIEALVLAQRRAPKRVLVLCKASLKLNMAREVQMTFPGDTVGIGYGSFGKWVIESYDTIWRKNAKKTLEARTFDVAICDEIQTIKNIQAKRTQGAVDLLAKIPTVYGLTGTPMQNRPIDLVGGLLALGYLTKGSRWGFMNRYCDPIEGWYGTEYQGASNLDELHRVLKLFMLRRLKEDVLPDLPPKIYTDDVVELNRSSGYWKQEKEYRDYIRGVKMGAIKATKLSRGQSLMELGKSAAIAKVDFAEERVRQALDSGLKVLLFSTFRQPVYELGRRFGENCIAFTGETAPDNRAQLIQKFQDNEFIRAAFLTTGAGGEGHNMTAAKIVMFLDQPWNPSTKEQAEDRAHRIGQDRGLQVVNLVAKDSIDEHMLALNAKKQSVISRAIDGRAGEFEASEGLIEELENYYAS